MVSRNTTLVPTLGLRTGPACEAGLSAGMRKERVSPQIRKKEKNHSAITWVVNDYNIRTEPCFFERNRTKLIPNRIWVFFSKIEPNGNKKSILHISIC